MNDISVKKINKLIEEFEHQGNKVDRLEIGYKTYAALMSDQNLQKKSQNRWKILKIDFIRK